MYTIFRQSTTALPTAAVASRTTRAFGRNAYEILSRRTVQRDHKQIHQLYSRAYASSSEIASAEAKSQPAESGKGKRPPNLKRQHDKKTLLRRTGLQVESPRAFRGRQDSPAIGAVASEKIVAGYCAAQEYDMMEVARILRHEGVPIDPTCTTLYPQVIHIELPADTSKDLFGASLNQKSEVGDAFIFPSGTVVTWNVPEESVKSLILKHLEPAAKGSHQLEDEDFEYVEDSSRERSTIKSGVIILGTRINEDSIRHTSLSAGASYEGQTAKAARHSNTVLAQIAFSSGLARSTKIAVLENQLSTYLEDTRDIPKMLMNGHLGSLPRSFIYQKMGQLLGIRGQLNLSSDITDSVPDILWDTEAELDLESYYAWISRELDTRLRIESLNQRMDYAHEIASILREELSVIRGERDEQKSTRLEWIIIALIAVEVGFGCWDLYKDNRSGGVSDVRVVQHGGVNNADVGVGR